MHLIFVPGLRAKIEAITYRRDGRVERIVQPAHSPLKNWVQILYALFNESSEDIVDTSGNTQSFDGTLTSKCSVYCNGGTPSCGNEIELSLEAPEGNSDYGLLAGYGTTPVKMDDYKLEYPYTHGEANGNLFYKTTILDLIVGGEVTIDSTKYKTMTLIIQRPVENRHTENQTINEIGLAMHVNLTNVASYYVLLFRDVLDNPITLAPTEATTLRYHLRWLIPA